jgi:hypothetical protein
MALFLLRLPSHMRDHLIAKDFKDCTKMAEYTDLVYSSRAGNTIAAVNTEYEAAVNAVSGDHRRELNTLGGGMIFLQDDESKQQFMVDTGAICSVLPHRSKATPTGPPLSGADRKDMHWSTQSAARCWTRSL